MGTLFVVILVGWFVVLPLYQILKILGAFPTAEQAEFNLDQQEKSRARGQGPVGTGWVRRLVLAAICMMVLFAAYAGIVYFEPEDFLPGVALVVWGAFGLLLLLAAPVWLLYLARDLRRLRNARAAGHSTGDEARSLREILVTNSGIDWAPYGRSSASMGRVLLIVGGIIQVAGVAAIPACLALLSEIGIGFGKLWYVVMIALIAAVVGVGHLIARAARQKYAAVELAKMLNFVGPPALYLRPFRSDTESFRGDHPQLANPSSAVTWSIEEVVSKCLSKYGPFIAVGDRQAEEQPPDAGRIYVRNEVWKELVRDLMQIARLIMVRASESPGIRWELAEALKPEFRSRTVILLVDEAGNPLGKGAYQRFREGVARETSVELPLSGWNSWYLWFDDHLSPQSIDADSQRQKSSLESATGMLVILRNWRDEFTIDPFITLDYRLLRWAPGVVVAMLVIWFFSEG